MPIVPQFQGGVIQEMDNGRASTSEVRLAQPTFDYAKNMEKALKSFSDAAGSIHKAAEIKANRNVKAEADEAELKYLEIERGILYGRGQGQQGGTNFSIDGVDGYKRGPDGFSIEGPNDSVAMPDKSASIGGKDTGDDDFYKNIPNGYFGTNGRNSVDNYTGSVELLKKEAQKILDDLSPWGRESLQSRIAERIASAETRMLSYRNNQEEKWHLDSAQARIEGLIRSAGDNPNNKDYLDRTRASIDTEVEYIAKLQGLDETQAAALRSKYHDLAEASRFTAWAQDNPVGALQAFQNEKKGISRDVAQKLADELFRTAKPQLGLMLSQQYGDKILDEKDFLKTMAKGGKTGIAVIDNLSTVQKMGLWSSAHSFMAQTRAVSQNELNNLSKNALSEASTYGVATNIPDEAQFIAAYGETKGKEAYSTFTNQLETTTQIHNYAGMTDAEIAADIEAAKPTPGAADFKFQKDLYEARVKAAKEISKARKEDSVGFACAGGQFGFQPLDFSNLNAVSSQLRTRVEKAGELAKAFGSQEKLLSKAEVSGLCSYLDAAPIEEKCKILGTIANVAGAEGIKTLSGQLQNANAKYTIALAGFDIPNGDITAGEKYLRGLNFIDTKEVKIDERAVSGLKAGLADVIGEDPSESVRGLYDSPAAAKMTRDLAKGIYAYNVKAEKSSDFQDCMRDALGGEVYTHNQRKIVLPRGVEGSTLFGEDFESLVNKHAGAIRNSSKERFFFAGNEYTPSQFADMLHDMDLKTEEVHSDGSVLYSVQSNGLPVYKADGKLYTFTLRK